MTKQPSTSGSVASSTSSRWKRIRTPFTAGVVFGAGVLAAWLWLPRVPEPWILPDPPGESTAVSRRFSLLALGDTGDQHRWPSMSEGQLAVARGLTSVDLSSPVDLLLLLGDNFYPRGLVATEMEARIRRNLVWPYCRFVALDGPRSDEVRDACSLRSALRRSEPPSIYAILGNHDRNSPESPELQRSAIPQWVSNWHLPDGLVEVVEFDEVSLILIDSTALHSERDATLLAEAIRGSPGPWRIAASHHPATRLVRGKLDAPSTLLRRALAESQVRVQLLLSGHNHNLQAVAGWPEGPEFHVIAGSGSTHRPPPEIVDERLLALDANGFVRVDIEESNGEELLRVSLYVTPRYPFVFWEDASLAASWLISKGPGPDPSD